MLEMWFLVVTTEMENIFLRTQQLMFNTLVHFSHYWLHRNARYIVTLNLNYVKRKHYFHIHFSFVQNNFCEVVFWHMCRMHSDAEILIISITFIRYTSMLVVVLLLLQYLLFIQFGKMNYMFTSTLLAKWISFFINVVMYY